jgi:hypothetical protein
MSSRTSRRGALGLLLVLGALLAAPASGWGAERSSLLSFHVPGSHGYRIIVNSSGPTASVTATRVKHANRNGSLSTYIGRRKPGTNAVRASFGALGSVAMRFHPSGPVTYSKPERGCIGPDRQTIRHGLFVGTLHFRGEGDYTVARAQRVEGKEVNPPSLDCAGSGAPPRRRKIIDFDAGVRSGLLAQFFFATTDRVHPARFVASIEQTEGSLAVHRIAVARASPLTFATDNALSFASLTPPAPFSGTGSLQRRASGARTWSGSLAVSFPGAPDVTLTGPQFKTSLTRSW